jgi:hypothetical protein
MIKENESHRRRENSGILHDISTIKQRNMGWVGYAERMGDRKCYKINEEITWKF